ncbi:LysR substrate-binding domain-containing protein [Burkholderia contaminans]|uniref:LysR substrate-binding domain-containing protein n=1 Tax=Burkholderia contaminans TaxID=488447 RepID=UPI0021AB60A1|nr:LysR substrate-binding domain-containing protein [Burkholderia contaminans]
MSIFIRVAAPYSLARRFLAPLLGEFCDWQPGMTAELIVSDDMADIVEQRIDIAARTGNLPDSGLIARRRRICAAPRAGVTCATVEGGASVDVLSARSGRLDRRARLRRQIADSRYRWLKAARLGAQHSPFFACPGGQ